MNRSGLKSVGYVVMILIGAASIVLPILVAALQAFVAAARALPVDSLASLWASLAALSALLGVWLIAQGIAGLRGRPSQPFRLPWPLLWIILFVPAAAALAVSPKNQWVLGAAQVLAALLPGLALLSIASRRLRGEPGPATWRQIAAQTGATLTVSLWWSMLWEIVALLGLGMGVGILLGVTPSGRESLVQLGERLSDPSSLASGELLREPVMLALLFALMSGFVPVIEEIGKVLAVGALALARRPSRAQAVMWGITCGATFSIYEAAFGNPFSTSAAMVSVGRVGALLIHCCTASLTALGLWKWISQHRARWFFLSLGLSMGLHAAWNALAIALSAAMAMGAATAVAAQVIALSGLCLLSLGAAYVLLRITGKPTANNANERE